MFLEFLKNSLYSSYKGICYIFKTVSSFSSYTIVSSFDLSFKIIYSVFDNFRNSLYAYNDSEYENNFSFRVEKAIAKLVKLNLFSKDDFKNIKIGICDDFSHVSGNYIYLSKKLFSKEETDTNELFLNREEFNYKKSYADNNQLAIDIALLLKGKQIHDYAQENLVNSEISFAYTPLEKYFTKVTDIVSTNKPSTDKDLPEDIIKEFWGEDAEIKDYYIINSFKNGITYLIDFISYYSVPIIAKPLGILFLWDKSIISFSREGADYDQDNFIINKALNYVGDKLIDYIVSPIFYGLKFTGETGLEYLASGSSYVLGSLYYSAEKLAGAFWGSSYYINKAFTKINNHTKDIYCKFTNERIFSHISNINAANKLIEKLQIAKQEDINSLDIKICGISSTKLSENGQNIYLSSQSFDYDEEISRKINDIKKSKQNDINRFNSAKNYNDLKDLTIELAMRYKEAQFVKKQVDFDYEHANVFYHALLNSINTNQPIKDPYPFIIGDFDDFKDVSL